MFTRYLATKHVIHFRYVTYPNSSSSFAAFTWATTTTTILTPLESHLNCDTRLNLDSQLSAPPHCTISASITIGLATRGTPLKPEPVATNRDWRWHIAEAVSDALVYDGRPLALCMQHSIKYCTVYYLISCSYLYCISFNKYVLQTTCVFGRLLHYLLVGPCMAPRNCELVCFT